MTDQPITDREVAALVSLETTERLAVRAAEALQAGDTTRALQLLVVLTDETSTRTVTAVKSLALSDRIAAQVSNRMRRHLDIVDRTLALVAAAASPCSTNPTAPTDPETTTLSLDRVAQLLCDRHDIAHAKVEHTGGGVATLYAGPSHRDTEGGTRYALVVGPGTYGGPTDSTIDTRELFYGRDDDGATDPTEYTGPADEAALAAALAADLQAAS